MTAPSHALSVLRSWLHTLAHVFRLNRVRCEHYDGPDGHLMTKLQCVSCPAWRFYMHSRVCEACGASLWKEATDG